MTVHDPSKIGKFAREQFSSVLMSDTKWRKLLKAVAKSEESASTMLVKFIDVEQPREMKFPPSLDCPHAYMDTIEFGPVELRAVEWLELPLDIEPLVRPIGDFPIERVGLATRVTGYRR